VTDQPAAVAHPTRSSAPTQTPDRDGELADAVLAAVTAVPGVAAMHSGRFGEVATYLPGRRVPGVQLRDDRAEVHIVVHWGRDLLATAAAVRLAAEPLAGRLVHVVIEDVIHPSDRTGSKETT
jgi:hypothetical protein